VARSGTSTGRHAAVIGVVAAAIALAYASSLEGELVMDAGVMIAENPAIRAARWENVLFLLTHDYWQPMATGGLYRPLTTLSYLFNYAVLGNAARPFGYHVVNLALHVLCAALVYGLAWQLTRRWWAAGFAAALFGLHPVATEAVANVIGRADLLAAFGVLAGLWVHARAANPPGPFSLTGIAAAGVVAAFSKENGLLLPAVLFLYDLVFRQGPLPRRPGPVPFALSVARLSRRVVWRTQLALLPVVVLYASSRWWLYMQSLPPNELLALDNPLVEASFVAGRLTALKVMGLQMWLLVFPLRLSADYSFDQIPVVSWPPDAWSDWQALLAVAVLAAIAAAARRLRPAREIAFTLVLFFLALLPSSNLLLLIGSIMAERFLYLPLAAAALLCATAAQSAFAAESRGRPSDASSRRVAIVTAALVLGALGLRTHLRNRDWRDELGLWSATVEAAPRSAKAHRGYASALFAADPQRVRLDRVIAELEQAVAIRDDYLLALLDLGDRYVVKGDSLSANANESGEPSAAARPWYEKAVATLEKARALEQADAQRFEARMRARGKQDEEIPVYGNAEVHRTLAVARMRLGRTEEALDAYRHALFLQPTRSQLYVDVSAAYARQDRLEDAAITLFQALTVDPANIDAANRLGAIYRALAVEQAIVEEAPGRARIELGHPAVRAHRCEAYRRLEKTLFEARSPGDASRVRGLAQRGGCGG